MLTAVLKPDWEDKDHTMPGYCYLCLYQADYVQKVAQLIGPYPTWKQLKVIGGFEPHARFTSRKKRGSELVHIYRSGGGYAPGDLPIADNERLGACRRETSNLLALALAAFLSWLVGHPVFIVVGCVFAYCPESLLMADKPRTLDQMSDVHRGEAMPVDESGHPLMAADPQTSGDGRADSKVADSPKAVGPNPPVKPKGGVVVPAKKGQKGKRRKRGGKGRGTLGSALMLLALCAGGICGVGALPVEVVRADMSETVGPLWTPEFSQLHEASLNGWDPGGSVASLCFPSAATRTALVLSGQPTEFMIEYFRIMCPAVGEEAGVLWWRRAFLQAHKNLRDSKLGRAPPESSPPVGQPAGEAGLAGDEEPASAGRWLDGALNSAWGFGQKTLDVAVKAVEDVANEERTVYDTVTSMVKNAYLFAGSETKEVWDQRGLLSRLREAGLAVPNDVLTLINSTYQNVSGLAGDVPLAAATLVRSLGVEGKTVVVMGVAETKTAVNNSLGGLRRLGDVAGFTLGTVLNVSNSTVNAVLERLGGYTYNVTTFAEVYAAEIANQTYRPWKLKQWGEYLVSESFFDQILNKTSQVARLAPNLSEAIVATMVDPIVKRVKEPVGKAPGWIGSLLTAFTGNFTNLYRMRLEAAGGGSSPSVFTRFADWWAPDRWTLGGVSGNIFSVVYDPGGPTLGNIAIACACGLTAIIFTTGVMPLQIYLHRRLNGGAG